MTALYILLALAALVAAVLLAPVGLRLRYDREDETELLIRVLSFGPMVKVTAPARLVAQVQARLRRQAALMAAPPE